MSERKFASTLIRDSEDKLGLTPEQVSQLLADANTSLAKTKGFTQIGDVDYGDGLIFTSLIKLLDAGNEGEEMAGISGIAGVDKDNPAFWAGGTYADALAVTSFLKKIANNVTPSLGEYEALAKIALLHSGGAKVGVFMVEESGRIILVNPETGKPRLVFSDQSIPLLEDLLSENLFSGSILNAGRSVNLSAPGTASVMLPGTLGISKDGSDVTMTGGSDFALSGAVIGAASFVTLAVELMKDDALYRTVSSISLSGGETSKSIKFPTVVVKDVPRGNYRLRLTLSGAAESATGSVGNIPMLWEFRQTDVRYFQFSLDGMMAFFSDNHIHFTETTGWDVRGKSNMPGVLLSTTVSTNGAFSNFWGAKRHASLSAVKASPGTYDIYHAIGHTNYSISANAYGNRTISLVSKSTDRCRVQIYNGTTLIDSQFDITLTGNNY